MIKGLATFVEFVAYDYSTGALKTGDAANITAYVSKDHGTLTVLTDTSATEISSTNAPGSYRFDVTAAEATADDLYFTAKSATGNVQLVPVRITPIDLSLYGVFGRGIAQSVTSTTLVTAASEVFADSTGIGFTVAAFGSTQGYWQARAATLNIGSTDTFTVDQWAVTPSGTVNYILYGTAPLSSAGVTVNAPSLRTALGMASANMDTQFAGVASQASNIQTRLPATLLGGSMQGSIVQVNGIQVVGSGTAADPWRPA